MSFSDEQLRQLEALLQHALNPDNIARRAAEDQVTFVIILCTLLYHSLAFSLTNHSDGIVMISHSVTVLYGMVWYHRWKSYGMRAVSH
jgi:hypothetical protein